MRLAAIYNVWADGIDLLQQSIDNIRPVVDGVIVVYSWESNLGNGQWYELPKACTLVRCEPKGGSPHDNETRKRNAGLEQAKLMGFTHFLMMDSDEFYNQGEVNEAKIWIEKSDVVGTVCKTKLYFAKPTLTIGYHHTIVPFIHKLTPNLQYGFNNRRYPYAIDVQGVAHIDPTRRVNITSGVFWIDITMHHYSWVRKDVMLKINNSSAGSYRKKADMILADLANAAPGYFCQLYQTELQECENIFGINI